MINAYSVMVLVILLLGFTVKSKKRFIALAALALFIVLGCRDATRIGVDSTTSYPYAYRSMEFLSWGSIIADAGPTDHLLFDLSLKLVHTLTNGNWQIYILLSSAFMMAAFAHFIRKYSIDPLQSILYDLGLLIYEFKFSGLKQGIAMSFLLFAFDFALERKPLRFALMVLLGTLFHFPAIVFLPAYFMVRDRVERSYALELAIMLALVYAFRAQILTIMNDVYSTQISTTGRGFFATKVVIMIGIVAMAILLRPQRKGDWVYATILHFMGIAIVFQTFTSYNNTFERLADYYFQFSVVLIPMIFEENKSRFEWERYDRSLALKRILVLGFCSFGVWRFLSNITSSPYMFPYRFFF